MWSLLLGVALAAPLDNFVETDDIGSHKIPHLGTSHVLVIPIDVNDGWTPPLDRIEEIYAEDGPFRAFWLAESVGRFDPIPFVADTVVFDDCPIPNQETDCHVDTNDLGLLFSDTLQTVGTELLTKLRDEQGLDLSDFDVNGPDGVADGYLDAVVLYTSMHGGVMFPFIAFGQQATVGATSDADPTTVTMSLAAFAPPDNHEFAHLFGFIDLYNGPGPEALMDQGGEHVSAYNRSLVGWSEQIVLDASRELTLLPVREGGRVLRFGAGEQFVLLANHDGAGHVTSIDERALPEGNLGFIDIGAGDLYWPNEEEPWLNRLMPDHDPDLDLVERRDYLDLDHASGGPTGWSVRVLRTYDDGALRLRLDDGQGTPPVVESDPDRPAACGCASTGTTGGLMPLWGVLALGWFRRARGG